MLKGLGVSGGIGIGRVLKIERHRISYTKRFVTEIQAEICRYEKAAEEFCRITEKQAGDVVERVGKDEAMILRGHIEMVRDPFLDGEVRKLIQKGNCAEASFELVCGMLVGIFEETGDEMTVQRAEDVRDICDGMLAVLTGAEDSITGIPGQETVIVASELTPSMFSGLQKENIAAIVTEYGNATSHSAIMAKNLGIPAVMSVQDAVRQLKNGELIIIDGDKGELICSPDEEQLKSYSRLREKQLIIKKRLGAFRGKPTRDADGNTYKLLCNIGSPEDALSAVKADGEGAGLFRTEFLFMQKSALPSEEEQFQAYRQAALALGGRELTIRTLDIGGDKEIPYLGVEKEANPFMGFRAIRYCLHNTEIFRAQLRAIIRASAFGNVSVMFPMICCADEIQQGRKMIYQIMSGLEQAGIAFDRSMRVGIMAETPAAAVTAELLAKDADFMSIGTNDLTGYAMAADRGNDRVAYICSVFQPAVLRMIKMIISACKNQGIPVCMCGEAASDPMMTPLLISFGLDSFSVSPPDVLKIRRSIAGWSREKADEVTKKVMAMCDNKEIIVFLQKTIKDNDPEISL